MEPEPRVGRRKAVALAGGMSAVVAVVLLVDPNRGLFPACPLKAATGFDCPLCGGTRATHALLTGDITGAIDFNALAALVVIPLLVFLTMRLIVALWRGTPVKIPVPTWPMLVVLFAFGIVRNLPFSWAEPLRA